MIPFALLCALATFAIPAFAQQSAAPPDLSGHWVLNATKSKLRAGPWPRAQNMEITVSGNTMTVQEAFNGQDATFAFLTDGKAKPVARVPHGMIIGKSHWHENTLITEIWGDEASYTFAQPLPLGPPYTQTLDSALTTLHETHRWTLSADGKTLTREIDGGKEICVYELKNDDAASDASDCRTFAVSGKWKLNRGASTIPRDGEAGSAIIELDCTNQTIRMNVTQDTTDEWQTFTADGNDHIVTDTELGELIHVAYWKESSLVTETITRGTSDTGPVATIDTKERWTLSPDGRQLFRERDDPKQVLVYDKR